MRSDAEIRQDIERELDWDPAVDAAAITVAVKNGVVELAGTVQRYQDRWQAERDALRVRGVLGVTNDIEVRIPPAERKSDADLLREARENLKSELPYSHDWIKVDVKDAWVTLEGDVNWYYQKERAEAAVRRMPGIRGLSDFIEIKPGLRPADIEQRIEEAFRRSAEVDAHRIQVQTRGTEVVLKGTVRSWAEREAAERAAWQAPGVRRVENRLAVQP